MLNTDFKKQIHPSLNIFTTNQSFQNYEYTCAVEKISTTQDRFLFIEKPLNKCLSYNPNILYTNPSFSTFRMRLRRNRDLPRKQYFNYKSNVTTFQCEPFSSFSHSEKDSSHSDINPLNSNLQIRIPFYL